MEHYITLQPPDYHVDYGSICVDASSLNYVTAR
jgi:hypothetical protein